MATDKSPNVLLNDISTALMNSAISRNKQVEMEARFGTRGIKRLTKADYDNVVKCLRSEGWTMKNNNSEGTYLLKIQTEYIDTYTGQIKTNKDFDRFRIECSGVRCIQDYCDTNDLSSVSDKHPSSVKIIRKTQLQTADQQMIPTANFDDFNFRVAINTEETINRTSKIGQEVYANWSKNKKVFRYMNRVSFVNSVYPFQIDLSIVKSSTRGPKGVPIHTFTMSESNVLRNLETYEIEIEVLNDTAKLVYKTPAELSRGMLDVSKVVLAGLQRTKFPISYKEQKTVLSNYWSMIDGANVNPQFIGPSPVTLGQKNIAPMTDEFTVPNITEPNAYCVTEKADGDRHLLYVNQKGDIYLINMNLDVIYTGAVTEKENCMNTVLDGELILHSKTGQFINTYAAFDIYWHNGVDVRQLPFINTHSSKHDPKIFEKGCRLPLLKDFVHELMPFNVMLRRAKTASYIAPCPLNITSKQFYPTFDGTHTPTIFSANNYLLRQIADGLFKYEVDGLIYTPTILGVGGNRPLESGPKWKITWEHCFKWKPSVMTATFSKSYNTIDFLVRTKKTTGGKDVITPIFEKGQSTMLHQYKTLSLSVGFDPTKHGYINPCQELLDETFYQSVAVSGSSNYGLKQFYPSDPSDPLAGICNVMLQLDNTGSLQMITEEGEIFDDEMVVEFRYDPSKDGLWKWVPLRLRYDKTATYATGQGVGANDYNTANNNWTSIFKPVTEEMLSTGNNIPATLIDDSIYYNSVVADKMTQGLRDFHNQYVKKRLIMGVSKPSDILIDLACGKAGDLSKWVASELSFVLGIDISQDNIENRLNGACARYIGLKKQNRNTPNALFINGDSSKNIRSCTNMYSPKANEILKAVFGQISKTECDHLGPAVVRQHGKGFKGFDVVSCQFAMHYMFENKVKFYGFMQNVAECCKLHGYFIATCYDGLTVYNMLRRRSGGIKEIYVDGKKVWGISRKYDADAEFVNSELSLGMTIDVYQDTINQTIPEYLVNADFLTSTMDKYGFQLAQREDVRKLGLPNATGMFSELYDLMEHEKLPTPYLMRDYERDISFLNRYFVYKKVATRDVGQLTKALLGASVVATEAVTFANNVADEQQVVAAHPVVKKIKKLPTAIKLVDATEVVTDTPPIPLKKKTRRVKPKPVETEEIELEIS